MEWHSSWTAMKTRPHILVVLPQAVASSWKKVCSLYPTLSPWAHQTAIADWLRGRRGSMVTADMGTGKTAIPLLAYVPQDRPITVCDITTGTGRSRAERLGTAIQMTPATHTLVALVNYESVWRTDVARVCEANRWQVIVCDESHRIKSPGSKASRWLHRFGKAQTQARLICLTGTPMPQGPFDIYGQARFIDESVYGTSFARFRMRYGVCHPKFPSKVLRYVNQEEFAEKLSAISYRVEADDVLDLPDTIHETIPVTLTKPTKNLHDALRDSLTGECAAGRVTVVNAVSKLLRMQQCTSGYAPIDGEGMRLIDGPPGKRQVLEDRLSDLSETEPVVVFCRFRKDLDQVAEAVHSLGREYAEVSGERKDLERWQAGDATILGVQIQSGGAGIDCSRAAYAFYYSLGFSLGDYEQSLARLRRPGQTRTVRYYHLVATGTVDEMVYAALRSRRDVIESIIAMLRNRMEMTV